MRAQIGVDAESGLVHSVIGTAANVLDVAQAAGVTSRRNPATWSRHIPAS
jgi:IS5 family transposase